MSRGARPGDGGLASALELHLHAAELGGILAERAAITKAPAFLRRNLSYVDRSNRRTHFQGSGLSLEVSLQIMEPLEAGAGGAAASAAASSRNPKEVICAALCVAEQAADSTQAFVPVACRAVVAPRTLPSSTSTSLALRLPLGGAGGRLPAARGFCLVLLHRHNPRLASLLRRSSWRASTCPWRREAAIAGVAKPLACALSPGAAFGLFPSGKPVGHSVIPLESVLAGLATASGTAGTAGAVGSAAGSAGSGGTGGSGGAGEAGPSRTASAQLAGQPPRGPVLRQRQGMADRLDALLFTHMPAGGVAAGADGDAGAAAAGAAEAGEGAAAAQPGGGPSLPFPWLQFRQPRAKKRPGGGSGSGGGGGKEALPSFQFRLRVLDESQEEPQGWQQAGLGGQQQQQQQQGAAQAGSKRKAEAALEPGRGRGPGRPRERPSGAAGAETRPADVPEANQQQGQQQGIQQQQAQEQQQAQQQQAAQQGQQQQPRVTFYFSTWDGARAARAQAAGFVCPHAPCRGLRCHSYEGLQQHLAASHSYLDCFFGKPSGEDGSLEVFLRCKRAWSDDKGGFLPRQRSLAALEQHPLLPLLDHTHIQCTFAYHCPKSQRPLRLPGGGGACPVDEEDVEMEAEAEEAFEGQAEEEARSRPAGRGAAGTAAAAAAAAAGAGAAGPAARRPRGGAAAAAEQPAGGGRGRGRGRPPKPGSRSGRRKQAAGHLRRQGGGGLKLLNEEGRPKFYHSRTCVALSEKELFAADGRVDSDGEAEEQEWQRDCRERLAALPGLTAEQQDFMAEWNAWVHHKPLHADADLPAALAAFAQAHADRLLPGMPFRHCMAGYLLNLWRFRLLSPGQMHTLMAGLPGLTAAPAAA